MPKVVFENKIDRYLITLSNPPNHTFSFDIVFPISLFNFLMKLGWKDDYCQSRKKTYQPIFRFLSSANFKGNFQHPKA